MVEYIKSELSQKWGEWQCDTYYDAIGNPSYLKNGIYFGYVFKPDDTERIKNYAAHQRIMLPEELLCLHRECNGFRLFLSSFSMFGFQYGDGEMCPFDIVVENLNIHARMKENGCDHDSWLFIGAFGDFVFAYDIQNSVQLMCVENGSDEIRRLFESIEELLRWFIPRIMDQYDDQFKKLNLNHKFKDIPALANAIFDLDEIMTK